MDGGCEEDDLTPCSLADALLTSVAPGQRALCPSLTPLCPCRLLPLFLFLASVLSSLLLPALGCKHIRVFSVLQKKKKKKKLPGPQLFSNYLLPCRRSGKESACHAVDLGLIPVLGRSPREGNSNLLQCSCLGNPMDRLSNYAAVEDS